MDREVPFFDQVRVIERTRSRANSYGSSFQDVSDWIDATVEKMRREAKNVELDTESSGQTR